MSAALAAQVVGQVQFVGMLQELNVPWPTGLPDVFSIVSLANLDPRVIIGTRADFPIIDFRSLFIVFAIIVPILIVVMTMLLFASAVEVLLFISTATGLMLIVAYLIALFTVGTSDFSGLQVLIIGCVLLAPPLIFYLYRFIKDRIDHYRAEKAFNLNATLKHADRTQKQMLRERRRARRFHREVVLRLCLYMCASLFVALFMFGVFDVPVSFEGIGTYIGAGSAALSCAFATVLVMQFFDRSRRFLRQITDTLLRYGLLIIISLLTASFVPAVSYSSSTFLCKEYVCPVNTRFNPNAYRAAGSYTTDPAIYCDPCRFKETDTCGAANITALCPATKQLRNWREPVVPCDDGATFGFYVSAAIVLVVYVVSIPLLFFLIVRYLTNQIMLKVALNKVQRTRNFLEDLRENWRRRLVLVQPTAASLYEAYAFDHRYFHITALFYRLLVTIALVIIGPILTPASLPIVFVFHIVMFLLLIARRPFLRPLEQWLSVSLAAINIFNCLFAFGYQYGMLPNSLFMTIIFGLVNFVLPAIFTIILVILTFRRFNEEEVKALSGRSGGITDSDSDEDKREDAADRDPNNLLRLALDTRTQSSILTRYFAVVGIFFFAALCAALVGLLNASKQSERIVTSPFQQLTSYTLDPYASWDAMTKDCCCTTAQVPPYDYSVMERWICNSGVAFNRGRISRDGVHNGTVVRGICEAAPRFTGCVIEAVQSRLRMQCPDGTLTSFFNSKALTSYALDYYF